MCISAVVLIITHFNNDVRSGDAQALIFVENVWITMWHLFAVTIYIKDQYALINNGWSCIRCHYVFVQTWIIPQLLYRVFSIVKVESYVQTSQVAVAQQEDNFLKNTDRWERVPVFVESIFIFNVLHVGIATFCAIIIKGARLNHGQQCIEPAHKTDKIELSACFGLAYIKHLLSMVLIGSWYYVIVFREVYFYKNVAQFLM